MKQAITGQVRSIDKQNHRVRFVASSVAIDSHGSIILPRGGKFERFDSNPICLWGHAWHGEPQDALGTIVNRIVTDTAIVVDIDFAYDINEKARQAFDLIEAGVLKAVSIGFIILEELDLRSGPALQALPTFARQALEAGTCDCVVTSWELMEVSVVLLPSNPEAITLQAQARGIDLSAALRTLCGEPADEPTTDELHALREAIQALHIVLAIGEAKKALANLPRRAPAPPQMISEWATPSAMCALLGLNDDDMPEGDHPRPRGLWSHAPVTHGMAAPPPFKYR